MQTEDFAGTVFRIDLRKRPRESSTTTHESAETLLTLPPPPSSVSLLLDVPPSAATEAERQEDRLPSRRESAMQEDRLPTRRENDRQPDVRAERDVRDDRERGVVPAETAPLPQPSAPHLSRTLQWLRESSNVLLCVLNLFVGIPLGSIIAMTLLASGFCCQRQGYPRAAKWLNSLCFVVNVLSITVSVITFMNSD
ncbi:MAG: hypothetical protein ACI4WT_09180 [Oligosphaeraceae bacterium]